MRFDDKDPFHRLVLWVYLKRARTASVDVVLTEWTRDPRGLLDEIERAATAEYPRLSTCTCGDKLDTVNAYVRKKREGAVRLTPILFTSLPMCLVEDYMRALSARVRVNDLMAELETASGFEVRKCLTHNIWERGGEDYDACLLRAGPTHVRGMQELHRHVLNVIHDSKSETLLVGVGIDEPSWSRCLVLHTNVRLRCNAVTNCGDRCERPATLRCETCRRAFYCCKTCKRGDKEHAEECDNIRCTCLKSRRRKSRHGQQTRTP
jgi:hypothetical protein